MFKNFFACKIVVAANQRYPGNIQRFFRLQNCLSSNPSKFSKYSKTFSPAKLSLPQIVDVLEIFKDLFACKNFSAATHHYSEKIQRLFRLRNCLSRKSSISWKYSKTFSAANLSQPQIIYILEIFKDFFACKLVLAANHRYPGNIQRLFRLQNCRSRNPSIHQYSENVQKLFRLQNCRSRKSAISWNYSNIFSPAKISQQQPINILKRFKDFLPAKMSQPYIIDLLEIFKDFFGCKNVFVATHQNSQNIQRLFRLQNCLSSNPSIF